MKLHHSKIWFASAVFLAMFTVWNFSFMSFLKSFSVLIHEICHASVILISGGGLEKIHLTPFESGEVLGKISGWSYVPAVSAGYIGSSLFGGYLLQRGFSTESSKTQTAFISFILSFFTLFYTDPLSYAQITGIIWSLLLFVCIFIPEKIHSMFLIFLGVSCAMYSIYDLTDFTGNIELTDAGLLASGSRQMLRSTGLDISLKKLSYLIAASWSLISIFTVVFFLKKTFIRNFTEGEHGLEEMLAEYSKGRVATDVAEWFLKKGIDLNGKPLPEKILKEIRSKENK